MPAFDDLPRKVRTTLRDLPFNINARDALKLIRTPGWNADRVVRRLRDLGIDKYRDEELDPDMFIAPDQLLSKDNWV